MTRPLRQAPERRLIALIGVLMTALPGCSTNTDAAPPAALAAGPCPSWVAYPADRHGNAGSPYLGCVNAVNLQSMVDDPRDLERGRTLGPANGERESLGVGTYQRGRMPPFKDSNAPRPTISLPGQASGTSP
jgi:type IV pilus biogenesis protein CpaD/CtpE